MNGSYQLERVSEVVPTGRMQAGGFVNKAVNCCRFKVQLEFSVQSTTKYFLIGNHYKTICEQIRTECVLFVQGIREVPTTFTH